MVKFNVYMVAILLSLSCGKTAIADEFGSRFYNRTPPGLMPYEPESSELVAKAPIDADDVAAIQPAAGQRVEDDAQNDINLSTE